MPSSDTCGGGCCAVFWLPREIGPGTVDGEFIADMRIELTEEQARERWAKFIGTEPRASLTGNEQRTTYTCRHWDEETRLCTVYDQRPNVCRDYPYGNPCSHGCSYQVPVDVATRYGNGQWAWDETEKAWRPRTSAYGTWDAEAGVMRPNT